ncbi:MAG: hypothetical protein NTX03_06075 [Bacteroidetes bacterium]|nr:hypothetical protein [Bacteroidota bacterium]
MNEIELIWEGPFQINYLPEPSLDKIFNSGGIYIWGFKNGEELIPHYVGIASPDTKISYRIYDHISHLKSGFCTIWRKADLFNIPKPEKRIGKALFFPPVSYSKNNEKNEDFIKKTNYKNILNGVIEYKSDLKLMINTFFFLFAKYENIDPKITDIEKQLIININKDNLVNVRGGDPKNDEILLTHNWNNKGFSQPWFLTPKN